MFTQSMTDRNISADDLISIGEDDETDEIVYPKVVDTEDLKTMMNKQDSILSF